MSLVTSEIVLVIFYRISCKLMQRGEAKTLSLIDPHKKKIK